MVFLMDGYAYAQAWRLVPWIIGRYIFSFVRLRICGLLDSPISFHELSLDFSPMTSLTDIRE